MITNRNDMHREIKKIVDNRIDDEVKERVMSARVETVLYVLSFLGLVFIIYTLSN